MAYANPEDQKALTREWKRRNPDKMREHRKRYSDQIRLDVRSQERAIRERLQAAEAARRQRRFRYLQKQEEYMRDIERLKTAPFSWQKSERNALTKEG